MIRANRYCRSASVTGKSGKSQFAPLKLRSLDLVTARCLIDVKFTLYYLSEAKSEGKKNVQEKSGGMTEMK